MTRVKVFVPKMLKIRHEKRCLKKLKKEIEDRTDIDIIPNCPVTVETDRKNYKENFDNICANFLGEWCEADKRITCPKEDKKTGSDLVPTKQQQSTGKKSSKLDKVEKFNNSLMGWF